MTYSLTKTKQMANIKNLQMWENICADARIRINKSMFGLRTTAIYGPTNSVIDANTYEYSPEDGKHIKRILEMPQEKMAEAINDYQPKTTDYGNYLAEVCLSRDKHFLIVQIFQFVRLNYEPATDVLIFEDKVAETLARLFA